VLTDAEKAIVLNALQQNHWNQTRAAKALGISRDNLRYRVRKYKLRREQGPGTGDRGKGNRERGTGSVGIGRV
jgi:DNA-binding NtrC family response regulator